MLRGFIYIFNRLKPILMKLGYPFLCRYGFSRIRPPKRFGHLSNDGKIDTINEMLVAEGIEVTISSIDKEEYNNFFTKAGYTVRYPRYYPNSIIEKSLEHFIAQKILALSPSDTYIDIASQNSPAPEIYCRLYGCKAYAQDMSYKPGVNGNKIGGDAASMPIPDGFASKMALHCSFEHFEDNSDIGFIKECSRVLCFGGVAVIVPLYLNNHYAISTDPAMNAFSTINFDGDAVVVASRGWMNRHGRAYDPKHLKSRVVKAGVGLTFEVVHLINPKEIHCTCYVNYAMVIKKNELAVSDRQIKKPGG